jgi:hypothetical protein
MSMAHNNDYDYCNDLDNPDNQFINEVKEALKQLNNIPSDIKTGAINKIDNIRTLKEFIEFIKELMKRDDLTKVITTEPLIKPEILNGQHVKWKNDELIQELIDKCLEKNDEGKHKFMLVVSHLLPILVNKSYKNLVDSLAIQLNYREIPQVWYNNNNNNNNFINHKFISIRENLWGYRFPSPKNESSSSKLGSFGKFVRSVRSEMVLRHPFTFS